ncbi:uncharacterized protein LOC107048590 [Diachasma alloeum]|uniref:uncharacterized protein LOC107048590 n=1 Tax=Diachasma alloeum TaxID=454923 RepID=UPI0007383BC1|nr:uncharacterized protein LOC107048590 [Diachasma alloeum]
MTTLILGIGLGLFIIVTLWLSAGLIFAVALRTDKRIGGIAVAIAAVITIILVSVPKSSEYPTPHHDKSYDHLFIWRVILLTLLAGSSLVALIAYIKYDLMESKRPRKITNWVF